METSSPTTITRIDIDNYYVAEDDFDAARSITTALPSMTTPVYADDVNEPNSISTVIEKNFVVTSTDQPLSFVAGNFSTVNSFAHTSSAPSALQLISSAAATSGSGGNQTELPEYMRFSHANVVEITLLSILFVIGLIGNATILLALVRHRSTNSRRSRITFLMLNLAVSDMLVVCVTIPIRLVWSATVQWRGDDLSCRVCMFARIFGIYLSSFILVAISIDRYLTIVYPFSSVTKAERAAKVMVAGAWIATAISSLPQLFVFRLQQHPQFQDYWQCITYGNFPSPIIELVYNIFTMLMTYALPLTIIIFCYWRILLTLHKQTRAAKKQRSQQNQRSSSAIVTAGVLTAGVLTNPNVHITSFPSTTTGERSMLLRSQPNGITHHNLHKNFSFRSKWNDSNHVGGKQTHHQHQKTSSSTNEEVIEDLSETKRSSIMSNGFTHRNDNRNMPNIPIIVEHLREHSSNDEAVANNSPSEENHRLRRIAEESRPNQTMGSPDSATSTTDCSSNSSNCNNRSKPMGNGHTAAAHERDANKYEKRPPPATWLSRFAATKRRKSKKLGRGDVPLIQTSHCNENRNSALRDNGTVQQCAFRRMLSIAGRANGGDKQTSSTIVALAESAGGLLVVPDDDSDSGLRRSQNITLLRAKSKTLKMAIILVLVFIMCWSPYYLMSFWYWVHPSSASTIASWELQVCLFCFAVSNACVNPVVYGIFNQPVVHDIKDVFPFCALKFLFHRLENKNKSPFPSFAANHQLLNNGSHTPSSASVVTTSPHGARRAASGNRRAETKSFRYNTQQGANSLQRAALNRASSMRYPSPAAAVATSQFVRLHRQQSYETPTNSLHQRAIINDYVASNGEFLMKSTMKTDKGVQTNGSSHSLLPTHSDRRLPPQAKIEELSSMELL